jgi:hypothetical protein
VFVHDFAHIDLPYPAVHAEVLRDDGRWLCPLGCAAYADGSALHLRVGPGAGTHLPSKMVQIQLDRPHDRRDGIAVAMRWVATGVAGLFPSMEADLEFAPVGESITQVTLSGTYKPPLGVVGRTVDALLLHRVAESTVRSFLVEVVATLEGDGAGLRLPVNLPLAPGTN